MYQLVRKPLFVMLLFGALLSGGLSSCKRVIENAKDDIVTNLITNGRWLVTNFMVGSTDHTTEYEPFEFQFNRNSTVAAIRTGASDVIGNWQPDATNMTITSAFPTAGTPLNRFNGVWQLGRTTMTTVEASRMVGSTEYKLGLRKK